MSGGQEKNFSSLGPKLRENRAQQYYGDKQRQIRVENIDYVVHSLGSTLPYRPPVNNRPRKAFMRDLGCW